MANRAYLVFPESEDPADCCVASDELAAEDGLPLWWLCLFAPSDLKTWSVHELAARGIVPAENRDRHVGALVAPLPEALSRLRGERDAVLARFGGELAGDFDEFVAGLAKCPFRLVGLAFHELAVPDEYLEQLKSALEALEDGLPGALDLLYKFQGRDGFGYEGERDRTFAFPWA